MAAPKARKLELKWIQMRKMEKLCGICRLPGHTRKHCPNVGTSSR
ncbi:unnamed protein product [Lathyrus sativus]|nr:unnamed protein product [Lathyrus sativus]